VAYVIAAPEMMTAAAGGLATICSNVNVAHLVAAGPTTAVLPAAADEVSADIAQLFSQHAASYQAAAGQAAAFGQQFTQNLKAGAFSYADAEATAAGLLQNIRMNLVEGAVVVGFVALLVALYVLTALDVFAASGQILTPGAFLAIISADIAAMFRFPMYPGQII